MKWKSIFKETAYISSIHFSTKVLGFLEKLLIAYLFGASSVSDAYFFSFAIFILIFDFFNESTSPALLPAYVKARKKGKERELFNSAFSFFFLTGISLSLLVSIFSNEIIKNFTGFPEATAEIASDYLRIISLGIGFVISSVSTYLFINSDKKFLPAALGDLIFKVTGSVFILYAIIDRSIGLLSLAAGILAGSLLKLLTHIIYLKKRGVKFSFGFDKSFMSVLRLSLPVVAGVIFSKGRILFDNLIVSGMAVGSITAIQLGYRVMEFSVVVLLEPFSTVLFPEFVSMAGEPENLRKKICGSLKYLMMIFIPVSLFAFVFRHDIIALLFKRGAFDEKSVVLTASAFSFYVLSMIFIGLDLLFSRTIFALGDTKFPPASEVFSILFHMVFVVIFRSGGILVVSLAFLLNRIIKSLLLFIRIRILIGFHREILYYFLKIFSVISLSLLVTVFLKNLISVNMTETVRLILSGLLFAILSVAGIIFTGTGREVFSHIKNE